MKYLRVTEKRKIPLAADPSITGKIGGAQWNNQTVIDEQLQVIARNDRMITRGVVVIILELVVAIILGLAIYVMAV